MIVGEIDAAEITVAIVQTADGAMQTKKLLIEEQNPFAKAKKILSGAKTLSEIHIDGKNK